MTQNLYDIFQALPGCYLVLAPDAPRFTILEVNDSYRAVTRTGKDIIGRPMFEVFPDNPGNPNASGVKNLTASLMTVLETKREHVMTIQRYDTRQPDSEHFDIRYWKPRNIPVLSNDRTVRCIIHTVEDVTDVVLLRKDLSDQESLSQKQITDAVRTTQELERVEISQELHDNVNQILNASRLYLELAHRPGPEAAGYLKLGHSLVEKAMTEVRKLSDALLHSSSEERALTEVLEELLEQATEVKKINVVKRIHLPDETLIEAKVKMALVRIVQEQLANVLKHSEARTLYINLAFKDGNLELMIRDDGRGFDMMNYQKGLGFQNMKSRAALMDGKVVITSYPGDGCRIEVSLPVKVS